MWTIEVWTVWVVELNCPKEPKIMTENQMTIDKNWRELNWKSMLMAQCQWNFIHIRQVHLQYGLFSTRSDTIRTIHNHLQNQTCVFVSAFSSVCTVIRLSMSPNGQYEMRCYSHKTALLAGKRISEMKINYGPLIRMH